MEKKTANTLWLTFNLILFSISAAAQVQPFDTSQSSHTTLYTNTIDSKGDHEIHVEKTLNIIGDTKISASLGVGVQQITPNARVDVNGNVKATGFTLGGRTITNWNDAGAFTRIGNDAYFTTGNVGINTQTPAERLEVNGNIKASGLKLGGRLITDWNQAGAFVKENDLAYFITPGLTSDIAGQQETSVRNRVGIGITEPKGILHIREGTRQGVVLTPDLNADDIVIENRIASGISILTNDIAYGTINFGDTKNNKQGRVVYNHHQDKFSIFAAAKEALTIDNLGNVGLGVTSPKAPLSFRPIVGQKIRLYDSANPADTYGFGVQAHELRIATSDQGRVTFYNGYSGTPRMTINADGKVGINTLAPRADLEIVGNPELTELKLNGGGSQHLDLTFQNDGTQRIGFTDGEAPGNWLLRVNYPDGTTWLAPNGGKVGIGTDTPRGKLEVAGSIRATKGDATTDGAVTGYAFEADGDTGLFAIGGQPEKESDLYLKTDGQPSLVIKNSGNIGIGTSSPRNRLEIAGGSVRTPELCIDSDCRTAWPIQGDITQFDVITLPLGSISFFDAATCPTGWTEVEAAKGRYLIGLPASGDLGSTVGTALANTENRQTGLHAHSINDPGHAHGVSDAGHAHTVNPPITGTTSTGNHAHNYPDAYYAEIAGPDKSLGNNLAGSNKGFDGDNAVWSATRTTTTNGNHNHAVNIGPFGSSAAGTGISIQNRRTDISLQNSGTTAGTNAPYIQYKVCKKTSPTGGIPGLTVIGGKVGIGTALPEKTLHIAGDIKVEGTLTANAIEGLDDKISSNKFWNQQDKNVFYNEGNVGIGTTTPADKLEVAGNIKINNPTSWSGVDMFISGGNRVTAYNNEGSFAVDTAGIRRFVIQPQGNVGIGELAPVLAKLHVKSTDTGYGQLLLQQQNGIGWGLGVDANENFFFREARGGSKILFLQLRGGKVGIGTVAPRPESKLNVVGNIYVDQGAYFDPDLEPAGASNPLCWAGSGKFGQCGSSLRYKEKIVPLNLGLSTIEQLNPVSFTWIEDKKEDLGLIAEQVASIDPLLATFNGEQVEGVKYDRLSVVLINAIKELKVENEDLKRRVEALELK